ncbi:MAG: beta-lactamase family protein, partial [Planctomycetota bacterium]|nr:beta-lactamase family protein [Planctomycetota bacterium]
MTKRRRWIAVAGLASVAASLPARGDDVVPITGRADATYAPFDRLMSRFVREQRVPGASFAAARGGRVVYARGFGYTSDDRLRAVEPTSLFRVASLSKPITALAVLTYVDSGAIALDDPVAALLTAEFERDPPVDPRLRSITIRQLLQHTGGWDSSRTFDPMFRTVAIAEEFRATPPAGPDLILRSMLRRPLDFDPGARYAYSNFGYSVLGRVLERLSMRSYAACVRDRVLSPLGIVDMSIGRTLPRDRDPREVGYRNVR